MERLDELHRIVAEHVARVVHPWSRGGQTALPNGQVLCRSHHKQKRASVPFGWQLRRLERRRATYFPPGVSSAVLRRAPRTRRVVADVA